MRDRSLSSALVASHGLGVYGHLCCNGPPQHRLAAVSPCLTVSSRLSKLQISVALYVLNCSCRLSIIIATVTVWVFKTYGRYVSPSPLYIILSLITIHTDHCAGCRTAVTTAAHSYRGVHREPSWYTLGYPWDQCKVSWRHAVMSTINNLCSAWLRRCPLQPHFVQNQTSTLRAVFRKLAWLLEFPIVPIFVFEESPGGSHLRDERSQRQQLIHNFKALVDAFGFYIHIVRFFLSFCLVGEPC